MERRVIAPPRRRRRSARARTHRRVPHAAVHTRRSAPLRMHVHRPEFMLFAGRAWFSVPWFSSLAANNRHYVRCFATAGTPAHHRLLFMLFMTAHAKTAIYAVYSPRQDGASAVNICRYALDMLPSEVDQLRSLVAEQQEKLEQLKATVAAQQLQLQVLQGSSAGEGGGGSTLPTACTSKAATAAADAAAVAAGKHGELCAALAKAAQSAILKQGTLAKRGAVNSSWKQRYFVLGNDATLRYFKNASFSGCRSCSTR